MGVIRKGRMCFSCLGPKLRICTNHSKVPKALKCAQCASWSESKSLALFSIFFCKQKEHGEWKASEIKSALEKYIGKLANAIVEANILFAVNFMFKGNAIEYLGNLEESGHRVKTFPQAPVIDSETGHRVLCEEGDICPESSESAIYLMQTLRVGDSSSLPFFYSGANTHLIDGQLARMEEL